MTQPSPARVAGSFEKITNEGREEEREIGRSFATSTEHGSFRMQLSRQCVFSHRNSRVVYEYVCMHARVCVCLTVCVRVCVTVCEDEGISAFFVRRADTSTRAHEAEHATMRLQRSVNY